MDRTLEESLGMLTFPLQYSLLRGRWGRGRMIDGLLKEERRTTQTGTTAVCWKPF
jgi:hypothetical protein